jgi:pSer/pThr/pTyr-binding forkhead associated (FHA) protein
LTPGQQIILGRADESVDTELLVDLTPYNARELGVSRKHAAIEYRGHKWNYPDVWLMDMGSANGTYLNGQRLIPHVSLPA